MEQKSMLCYVFYANFVIIEKHKQAMAILRKSCIFKAEGGNILWWSNGEASFSKGVILPLFYMLQSFFSLIQYINCATFLFCGFLPRPKLVLSSFQTLTSFLIGKHYLCSLRR
jgi:hypothetical protein